jgi:glycosyltransferase 2 family protein
MSSWKSWVWPGVKLLLAAAILAGVGWQFYRDLWVNRQQLQNLTWRPAWLILSAACYLAFLTTSGLFWRRLLRHYGQAPPTPVVLRAYFIGHLGKYVPGKAIALLLRGMMVKGHGVRLGLAILTSFYEVLTTMAAGAMVAAVVFIVQPPRVLDLRVHPGWAGLGLLVVCGVPLLPAVFNRIVMRLAKRMQTSDAEPVAALDLATLVQGLAMITLGWLVLGVGVWAGLCSVLPDPPALTVQTWLECTGIMGLAYVAGFLAVFMPAGVGAREYVLLKMLAFAGPGALIAAAVLLMRAAWTIAELIVAALAWPCGGKFSTCRSNSAMGKT